ncbi:peptidase inhibitor family I36 protein [Streptomyces sp. NPDC001068]|uniref:peptidase inhibitor family I36 protein n=1 Tax=Streptomyces sp. NPDC001068 TaxID=3364544 RepID=UPI0036AA1335
MNKLKRSLVALSLGTVAAAGAVTGAAGSAAAVSDPCPSAQYEFCIFKDVNYGGDFYGVRWGASDSWVNVPASGKGTISSVINNTNYTWNLRNSSGSTILVVGKFYWLSSLGSADNKTASFGINK